ncbi:hypothetical protein CRM22_006123, partial [Opisthorchis felineus]
VYVTMRIPEKNEYTGDLCKWLRMKRPQGWEEGVLNKCQVHQQDESHVTMKVEISVDKLPHFLHNSPTDVQSWFVNQFFWDKVGPCVTSSDIPGRTLFNNVQQFWITGQEGALCDKIMALSLPGITIEECNDDMFSPSNDGSLHWKTIGVAMGQAATRFSVYEVVQSLNAKTGGCAFNGFLTASSD